MVLNKTHLNMLNSLNRNLNNSWVYPVKMPLIRQYYYLLLCHKNVKVDNDNENIH